MKNIEEIISRFNEAKKRLNSGFSGVKTPKEHQESVKTKISDIPDKTHINDNDVLVIDKKTQQALNKHTSPPLRWSLTANDDSFSIEGCVDIEFPTNELPPDRIIEFETDKNDVWDENQVNKSK